MNQLLALLEDREVGTVTRANGRLRFTYSDAWRNSAGAFPLSLSMPLAAADHPHGAIEPFLWGLLPDNDLVLHRWGRRFHVSPRSAFSLLAEVGEDCAGAIQFVRPERLKDLAAATEGRVDWLSEDDVAARLRELRADVSAWRDAHDAGQFSLAGAQPKTALFFDGQRWGVPSGRTPTTHILKPHIADFDGHAQNEHLCLALARDLGLPAARSEVKQFGDVTAIVVERYDRIAQQGRMRRVHQEDTCQALGVHPTRKYQNEGGPGAAEIFTLLRSHGAPARDEETFLNALIFNWLIGGTDAHAKNYSILIGAAGSIRLAPLYDLASIHAYRTVDPRKARLAMKIGGEYRLTRVGPAEWHHFAQEVRLDPGHIAARIRGMAEALPDRLSDEIKRMKKDAMIHPVIDAMAATLPGRAAAALRTAEATA